MEYKKDVRDNKINNELKMALGYVGKAMKLLEETDIRMVTDKGWVSVMNAHCSLQNSLITIVRTLSERGVDVKSEFGVELDDSDSK